MDRPAKVVIADLRTQEVRPPHNWHEWLLRWQVAETHLEQLGLLHGGFDVQFSAPWNEPEYDEIDRLTTYLMLADGWRDSGLLKSPEEQNNEQYFVGFNGDGYSIRKTSGEMRQLVARKAFEMLSHNLFKPEANEGRNGFEGRWRTIITSERLLPIIQNFFMVEEHYLGDVRVRNMAHPDSRNPWEHYAEDFLIRLARFVWGWHEAEIRSFDKKEDQDHNRKHNEITRVRFDAAKLWLLEILVFMGKLNVLHKHPCDQLSNECVVKLTEIAMRSELRHYEHSVESTRRVATLEEACLAGSSAAWFLKEREVVTKERNRLEKILRAEKALETAARQVRKLKGE